jgi:prepilin signal peptidase PulO-like enzyme (type II secretory pathway)
MFLYPILVALFVFGLIIGSFLNVVILRWNTGMRIASGRSGCFTCGKTLTWKELIPVLSFVAQKGKCKNCKSKISWQYPAVELLTAVIFPLAFLSVADPFADVRGFVAFILTAIVFCAYIIMAVYDIRHKIIPDFFSYGAALVALALIAFDWCWTGSLDMSRLTAGPALFLFFYSFWFFSKGRAMGRADANLGLSVGWMVGLLQGISAVLFSFWIGAIFFLIAMLLQKLGIFKGNLGMKSEIPFGPFIILSFFLVFLFHIDVYTIFSFLTL